jgi:tetratricopeptide (TPR) repeat protein
MLELTHLGRAALDKGHARRALEFLNEKHQLVIAKWGKDSVFAVTSAVDLGDAMLACGKHEDANQLLDWATSQYEKIGVGDERLIRALSTSAMNAYQAANYQHAETKFTDLVSRYKAMGPEHDVERAMAIDHLAQVLLRQSKNDAAEPLLLEALAIFERNGSDPAAIAVCLSVLARLRFADERYREAEQLQRRAIANHEQSGDEMNLAKELDHLAVSLAMRAQNEERADLAVEAVTHGERAFGIFEKYLPQDHRRVRQEGNCHPTRPRSRQAGDVRLSWVHALLRDPTKRRRLRAGKDASSQADAGEAETNQGTPQGDPP